MRLQKFLSGAGVCSRREAENRIAAGRVLVNGRPAVLGESVEPGRDAVTADGEPVSLPPAYTYVMLNKPRGVVTTLSDEKGRPTVAGLIRDVPGRLFPVGRLDCDSEGLLILTDDGETANRLAHPSHGVRKTYHALVEGPEVVSAAERLRSPVKAGEDTYAAAEVAFLRPPEGCRALLAITIGEGKNREIRRMCAAVGLRVLRLRRVAQGALLLGNLESGKWRYLTPREIEFLHQIR